MKKIALSIMLILVLIVVPTIILAEGENVAKIGGTEYASLPEAIKEIQAAGDETTITLLKDVTDGPGFIVESGKNIVIDFAGHTYNATTTVGSKDTENNGCQLLKGATVTFKNGTFTSSNAETSKMIIQNYSNLTLDNMVIDGTTSSVTDYAVSNNCGRVKIINGTSIKANEGKVALDMCWAPRWYPEGTQITVNTTGTITGNIELGTWGEVDENEHVNSLLTIETVKHDGIIDIKKDFLKESLTVVGGSFVDIADAVEASPDGAPITITLLKDVTNGDGFIVESGKNIVIDFAEHTYNATTTVGSTGTENNGCQLLKGATVTFKNGTFTSSNAETSKMVIQNYSNLTLDNMVIDGTKSTVTDYAVSNNCGEVKIINGTSIKANEGSVALDMCWAPQWYPEGTQITVNTTGTVTGDIELGTWGEVDENEHVNSSLVIENINHIGNIKLSKEFLEGQCSIIGGIFDTDVSKYVVTEGWEMIEDGGKYIVREKQPEVTPPPSTTPEPTPEVTPTPSTTPEPSPEVTPTPSTTPETDLTKEVELPSEVKETEELKDNLIESLKEAAKENPLLAEILKNNNVEVKVEVVEVKQDEIESVEKDKIEKALEEKTETGKILKYLDISILVKNNDENGEVVDKLSKVKEEIKFTVALPEELPDIPEGFERTYYIVKLHNGEVEIIEDVKISEDGKSLIFASDEFSTYAIAYNDVEKKEASSDSGMVDKEEEKIENVTNEVEKETSTTAPVTGDNIVLYVVVAVIALAGIVVLKKANTSKKGKH